LIVQLHKSIAGLHILREALRIWNQAPPAVVQFAARLQRSHAKSYWFLPTVEFPPWLLVTDTTHRSGTVWLLPADLPRRVTAIPLRRKSRRNVMHIRSQTPDCAGCSEKMPWLVTLH